MTFTGADGLSARRESRAFTQAKSQQQEMEQGQGREWERTWLRVLPVAGYGSGKAVLPTSEVLGALCWEYELH